MEVPINKTRWEDLPFDDGDAVAVALLSRDKAYVIETDKGLFKLNRKQSGKWPELSVGDVFVMTRTTKVIQHSGEMIEVVDYVID